MSDRWAVALAVAVVVGALWARGPTPTIGAGLVLAAFLSHRPLLLVVAGLVLTAGLAARAEDGLVPATPSAFDGWVTLLSDPDTARTGVRADVRLDDGRHLQAESRELSAARAGERLLLSGHIERPPPGASWLADRHVVGVLAIDAVRARSPGAPWTRAANGLRAVLERGAVGLPTRERPLFLGFVLGDTRGQPPDIADDFRGAGLSHLLAVSGQNVAFTLTLAGPALRRLRLSTRFVATVAVIAFFALMTRFEPSVLRASAMAALAVTASTLGREASSVRLLALAVAGLVLLDPFLVRSVGFQLSVAACLGIALLSPVIARHLPGPRVLAETLAITIGAQVGVAPLLVSVFGGVPVAAIPANLLASPAEAPVMVWGLGAGLVAGLAGGGAATVLHWPTHLLISWIAWVARWAAALPLGELGGLDLIAVAAGAVVASVARVHGIVALTRLAIALVAVAIIAPAVQLHATPPVRMALDDGATLWRADGAVLELDGRVDTDRLLEGLRRAGVSRVDIVIARTEAPALRVALDALAHRYPMSRVLEPSTAAGPMRVTIGRLLIDVRQSGQRLIVDVSLVVTGGARGPPV